LREHDVSLAILTETRCETGYFHEAPQRATRFVDGYHAICNGMSRDDLKQVHRQQELARIFAQHEGYPPLEVQAIDRNKAAPPQGGILVLVRNDLADRITQVTLDANKRTIWIQLKLPSQSVTLCATYAPADRSLSSAFFRALRECAIWQEGCRLGNLLVLGDLNLHGSMGANDPRPTDPLLLGMLGQDGLVDVMALHNATPPATFHMDKQTDAGKVHTSSRIDHCLASPDVASCIDHCKTCAPPAAGTSNHLATSLKLSIQALGLQTRGPPPTP
jgi:exonuclease III